MEYKDMSLYRNGRLESRVVQVWLNDFKNQTLEQHIMKNLKLLMSEGTPSITPLTIRSAVEWLDSEKGIKFLCKAFEAEVSLNRNVVETWEQKYQQSFMNNIIYRQYESGNNNDVLLDKIYQGTGDVSEICVDTFIGWLNTYVGRQFLRDTFGMDIPQVALDGTE